MSTPSAREPKMETRSWQFSALLFAMLFGAFIGDLLRTLIGN